MARFNQTCLIFRLHFLVKSPQAAAASGGCVGIEPVISLHDSHGKVIWANYAPTPATLDELIGSYPWDWVDEPDKLSVKSRFSVCIALGEPQYFQSIANVHGRRLPLDCRIDPTSGSTLPVIARTRVMNDKVLRLTEREKAILRLTVKGLSMRAIGKVMHLSTSTVATYRSRAASKVGAKTFAELAIFAFRELAS